MTAVDPFGLVGAIVDGRYRVLRVVGQGGFGVVYRAQHLGFDSPIALKLLKLPDECSSPRRQARIVSFQREGRVLFELSHLHASVLRAHETGAIRGRDGSLAPYLALEWLDGVSLAAELKARRARTGPAWSLQSALDLLHGPAEALAIANARGIAHRDVKPANIFIATRDGEQCVKILDFGIAKLVDAAADATEGAAHALASTASFTPLYAAPEQWVARLGATGTWTDVHALALVLVELLCGRQPFLGREPAQLMAACLDPLRPTPAVLGASVSAEVEAVFARALALEPRSRFPEVGAFWSALATAAGWQPPESAPAFELFAAAHHGASEVPTEATNPLGVDTTVTTARSVSLAVARRAGPPASRLWSAGAIAAACAASVAALGAYAFIGSVPKASLQTASTERARPSVAPPASNEAPSSCTDVKHPAPTTRVDFSAAATRGSHPDPLLALRSAARTLRHPAPSAGAAASASPRAPAPAALTAAPAPNLTAAPARSFPRFD